MTLLDATYFAGSRGLLVRHDYVADVVGRWARAAHLCRWVRPIGPGNRPLPFPTMVWIRLADVRVETG
jgi:hypothetical protein